MKKNKVMQKTFIGILVIILVVVLFALNNSTRLVSIFRIGVLN